MDSDRSGAGHPKPKVGLIVLQNDYTLEDDARYMLAGGRSGRGGVSLHVTRIKSAAEVSVATLGAMEESLTGAAALFPEHARFEAVGYGCTSASAIIGADRQAGSTTVRHPL